MNVYIYKYQVTYNKLLFIYILITEKIKGVVSFLKKDIPSLFYIHCVAHREHIIATHLSSDLFNSLNIIIKTINTIKRNSLHDRIFQQLCKDNGEDYTRVLLHIEV